MLQVTGNLQQASNVLKNLICAVKIIQDVFCFCSFLTAIQVTLEK